MATISARVVAPKALHNHTIIFLHGRGSNGSVFCNELFESEDSSDCSFMDIFPSVKWVFPSATQPYTSCEGDLQWFDMSSVQRPQENGEIQKLGLWRSVTQILQMIKQEADVIGSQNVILAGISQGCATAIFALLVSGMQLGGFIGLCGWLPLADEIQSVMNVPGRVRDVLKMPVLLQHCQDDDVVPVENGNDFRKRLEELGMGIRWECFEQGGHWLNEPRGMDGLVNFIQAVWKGT
ncbi:hypothetical protein G6011_01242 [Alternaria panax]|uniref:Phospholipase/carboxylesterase/thioesterase domain-containing protein n=1 Tax=Alternaria panax TaxID=48097 RepID=A0AAD4IJI7_9PLEO|nr:hypothetical protein G6011_01242 [Alternaria panax]